VELSYGFKTVYYSCCHAKIWWILQTGKNWTNFLLFFTRNKKNLKFNRRGVTEYIKDFKNNYPKLPYITHAKKLLNPTRTQPKTTENSPKTETTNEAAEEGQKCQTSKWQPPKVINDADWPIKLTVWPLWCTHSLLIPHLHFPNRGLPITQNHWYWPRGLNLRHSGMIEK
jgi:hypothetical protein